MSTPSKTRQARPLLRAASLGAAGLVTACASGGGEQPLPGNPKGSMYDDGPMEVLVSGNIVVAGPLLHPASVVYLSLSGPDGQEVARKTLPAEPMPESFSLTRADLVLPPGSEIPASLTLRVALDGDGNPETSEDLPSWVASTARGAQDLEVRLEGAWPLPGNPKGSMYDRELEKELTAPKRGE